MTEPRDRPIAETIATAVARQKEWRARMAAERERMAQERLAQLERERTGGPR